MRNGTIVLIAAALTAAAWLAWKFELRGLQEVRLSPRQGEWASTVSAPVVRPNAETIRIASFNLQVFGEAKLSKPHVVERLAESVRQFDVVAIQEVRAQTQDVVPRLVEAVNASGRVYDFVISDRLGRSQSKEQYAYLFDTARVEVDRGKVSVVNDPYDLLHREPLLAQFRVKAAAPETAFTFLLVNVHVDPDEAAKEVDVLADLFPLVRQAAAGEDDILLVGDFNTAPEQLGRLITALRLSAAVIGTATNTRGTAAYDNLIFDPLAASEFTGRAGVFDFLREFNLSLEDALEISDHLPVWAEFSIHEGGVAGHVARRGAEMH